MILLHVAILGLLAQKHIEALTSAENCPTGCTCDDATKVLICHGWKYENPPYVPDIDDYESLDLSSDSGTEILEEACTDPISVAPLSALGPRGCASGRGGACVGEGVDEDADADEGRGAALLGEALEAGRLPGSWLGSGRFVWLLRLRMRGAGLRLVHKDAFRYQLKLRCVDLSKNRLARLNVFTWQRHNDMHSLILAGNKELNIPSDAPVLYSKSLRVLNLSGCGLNSLPTSAFDGVPSLEKLDLSNNGLDIKFSSPLFPCELKNVDISSNNMHYLSSELAERLANVSEIMLDNNPWRCDCHLKETWKSVRQLHSSSETMLQLRCFPSNRSWTEVFEKGKCEDLVTAAAATITTAITTAMAIDASVLDFEPTQSVSTSAGSIIYTGESTVHGCGWMASIFLTIQSALLVCLSICLCVYGCKLTASRAVRKRKQPLIPEPQLQQESELQNRPRYEAVTISEQPLIPEPQLQQESELQNRPRYEAGGQREQLQTHDPLITL